MKVTKRKVAMGAGLAGLGLAGGLTFSALGAAPAVHAPASHHAQASIVGDHKPIHADWAMYYDSSK